MHVWILFRETDTLSHAFICIDISYIFGHSFSFIKINSPIEPKIDTKYENSNLLNSLGKEREKERKKGPIYCKYQLVKECSAICETIFNVVYCITISHSISGARRSNIVQCRKFPFNATLSPSRFVVALPRALRA